MTDLRRVAGWIGEAQHVVVLTGAGVSAESGVPTFRGAGGLWRGRDVVHVATPEGFQADPRLVWEFYNERRECLRRIEPNPGHYAIARLAGLVDRFTLITQNVDRLHQRAGSQDVIELHGNIHDLRCSECKKVTDRTGESLSALPLCDVCGGILRPAVVWFGEMLPDNAMTWAVSASRTADLMLVVGTSGAVWPASSLAGLARGPSVEINLEPTHGEHTFDAGLYGPSGVTLPTLVAEVEAAVGGKDR